MIDVDRRVTAIAEGLTKMGGQVQAALDFRNSLLDAAGAPLDLRALSGRVADLETIRDRLRLADGEVARMRDFESRVAGLEARIVDDGVLDSRLGQRFTALVDDPGNPLTGRAAAAAAATLEPRIAAVEAGVETTRGGIGTLQAQRNADAAQIASLGTRLNTQTARTDSLDLHRGRPWRADRARRDPRDRRRRRHHADRRAGRAARRHDESTHAAGRTFGVSPTTPRRCGPTSTLSGRGSTTSSAVQPRSRAWTSRLGKVEAASENVGALGNRLKVAESSLAALDAHATMADSRIDALSTVPNRVAHPRT